MITLLHESVYLVCIEMEERVTIGFNTCGLDIAWALIAWTPFDTICLDNAWTPITWTPLDTYGLHIVCTAIVWTLLDTNCLDTASTPMVSTPVDSVGHLWLGDRGYFNCPNSLWPVVSYWVPWSLLWG